MNRSLLILGLNVIVVSIILAVYGYITGDNGLIGIAASTGIIGGVLSVYSGVPREVELESMISYSKSLLNGLISTLEDLDLLESQVSMVKKRDTYLLVYSKTPCPDDIDPGVGFTGGSPYIAIPIEPLPEDIVELPSEISDIQALSTLLKSTLVNTMNMCSGIGVEYEAGVYRVSVLGIQSRFKYFANRPFDPYTITILYILSRYSKTSCIRLIERRILPDGLVLTLREESE